MITIDCLSWKNIPHDHALEVWYLCEIRQRCGDAVILGLGGIAIIDSLARRIHCTSTSFVANLLRVRVSSARPIRTVED